ncbi:DUF2398 family protein [Candidatus Chlorohelix sp.]|uniref:DUF2398 family protein n=1 Tax=Candidatus Chlorohelix sp. TaxID=3139201 RepID=UPI003052235A
MSLENGTANRKETAAKTRASRLRQNAQSEALTLAHVTLMEHEVITRGQQPDLFRLVNNQYAALQNWHDQHTGWRIRRSSTVIRLVRVPAALTPGYQFKILDDSRDFACFCWTLWYAETRQVAGRGNEQQFLMSQLAERIEEQSRTGELAPHAAPLDFKRLADRYSLSRVLRALQELGGLQLWDGGAEDWVNQTGDSDALWEFTDVTRSLLLSLEPSRVQLVWEMLDGDPLTLKPALLADAQKLAPLQRAWRTLLLGPALYKYDDSAAFAALLAQVESLRHELAETFGWQLDLRREYAAALRASGTALGPITLLNLQEAAEAAGHLDKAAQKLALAAAQRAALAFARARNIEIAAQGRVTSLRRELASAQAERETAQARYDALTAEEGQVLGQISALESSEGLQVAERLAAARETAQQAANRLAQQTEQLEGARQSVRAAQVRQERVAGNWRKLQVESLASLGKLRQEAAEKAEWLLATAQLEEAMTQLTALSLEAEQPPRLLNGLEGLAGLTTTERVERLLQLEELHRQREARASDERIAREREEEKLGEYDLARQRRESAQEAVTLAREELATHLRQLYKTGKWVSELPEYRFAQLVSASLRDNLADYRELARQFARELENSGAHLRQQQAKLLEQRGAQQRHKSELEELYRLRLAEPDKLPIRTVARQQARARLQAAGITALPLYALVDSKSEMEGARTGQIERMLQEAGLLDALVLLPEQQVAASAILQSEQLAAQLHAESLSRSIRATAELNELELAAQTADVQELIERLARLRQRRLELPEARMDTRNRADERTLNLSQNLEEALQKLSEDQERRAASQSAFAFRLAALYDSAASPGCPRLLALDEAFDKASVANNQRIMEFLVLQGFQWIMTGPQVSGTGSGVPVSAEYQMMHEKGSLVATAVPFFWIAGKELQDKGKLGGEADSSAEI